MKILAYGLQGWIGKQFLEISLKNGIETVSGKSRVEDIPALQKEIEKIQPTHIISFIGRTHGKIKEKNFSTIDYLEQEGKLVDNIRDNLFAPLSLAFFCHRFNIHFSYLGTGCIFAYDESHPFGKAINGFNEDSLPNFFGSSYSIVKGYTDRLMKFFADSALNIRIRMPINGKKNTRNFITKITTYQKICSIPNSMTVLPELLPLVLDMQKKKITGTINLTNPGLISHNEILELYKKIVDTNFCWENFSQEDQLKILACDRSNNYLDTKKLEEMYPKVHSIKDSISNCLEEYKKNLNAEN